jgi:hypothetical protein
MMHKLILVFLIATTFATKALGGHVSADHLAIGDNATNIFGEMATLNWVSKKQYQPVSFEPLIVNKSNTEFRGNHTQYFGNQDGHSGTNNLLDLYLEHSYSPNVFSAEESSYQAIAITFSRPVSRFVFQAEDFNGTPQCVFLFTPDGDFIRHEYITSHGYTGDFGIPISGFNHTFDLTNENVGSIILGSENSATYYYAFSVDVPEPSGVWLMIMALAGLGVGSAIKRKAG